MNKELKFRLPLLVMAWVGMAVAVFLDYDWVALIATPIVLVLFELLIWSTRRAFKEWKKTHKKRSKS